MKTLYDIVGRDDDYQSIYQIRIVNVNGSPLHVGPKVTLNDREGVQKMINMAGVIHGIQEPEYPNPARVAVDGILRMQWQDLVQNWQDDEVPLNV